MTGTGVGTAWPSRRMLRNPVLVLVLVLVVIGTSGTTSGCSRWNCPCSGALTKRSQAGHVTGENQKRLYQSYHIDTELARRKTRFILQKLIRERFHDDDHVTLLEDCTGVRSSTCTDAHLHPQCDLEGLPTLPAIHSLSQHVVSSAQPHGVINFATTARDLLARLAVFVDQARRDEETHSLQQMSLADDIRALEEQHLYHILCNLHADFNRFHHAWNNPVSWNLMQLGCRLLSDQAPTDNRNYMVFYTLEQLLANMATQFRIIQGVAQ